MSTLDSTQYAKLEPLNGTKMSSILIKFVNLERPDVCSEPLGTVRLLAEAAGEGFHSPSGR